MIGALCVAWGIYHVHRSPRLAGLGAALDDGPEEIGG